MIRHIRWIQLGLWACACGIMTLAQAQDLPTKKVLQHTDYEIWNSASGFKLSPDGAYLVYTLTPPSGDQQLILKATAGPEVRMPIGRAASASPAAGISSAPQFSPDSKLLFAALTPTQAELEKARSEKKKQEEFPRPVLAVIETATGKVVERIERVRTFQIVGEDPGFLIYQREAKQASFKAPASETKKEETKEKEVTKEATAKAEEPKTTPTPSRPAVPTEYVLRDLSSKAETVLNQVSSLQVTKDETAILVNFNAKEPKDSGLFFIPLDTKQARQRIYDGTGRTSSFTWDADQKRLVFFVNESARAQVSEPEAEPEEETKTAEAPKRGGPTAPPPAANKVKVFLWDRSNGQPATELLPATPKGLNPEYAILDRGGLSFSADGLKLTVTVGPIPPEPKASTPSTGETAPAPRPTTANAQPPARGPGGRSVQRGVAQTTPTPTTPPATDPNRIDLDLWHWKDELIQPMQKVRGTTARTNTYRAVYFFDTKEFRQISNDDWDVTTPAYGDWTRASNDKAYRAMQWMSPTPRDYAFVNIRTGEQKPWLQANVGQVEAPVGNFALNFNGKDWLSTELTTGKVVNLTEKLKVRFYNEEFDTPTQAPAYGLRGYTEDRKHAIISDRYDLWKFALDGSSAVNLTKIGREAKMRFSFILLDNEDSTQKLDLNKTYLLRAEHEPTGDTGFYNFKPGQTPQLVIMGAKRYGPPTKAKKADLYLLTVQTYYDYPDYYLADANFNELKRLTDIQPRKREFNWGKAELVSFKSADGVPLKGMLIKPENFNPNQQYPMMVYIYERLSQGLHNFRLPSAGTSINPTFYASNGYLVFMPDICYTIGSPGQSALKCVLPAIQAVVDQGFVNEQAIGIQGHSWGGYQIAYMVTQTNRFKAANAGAPVSNMVSAYGGIRWGTGLPRQFQYEQTQSRIGATLWQAPMKYIENSPIFMADRVQTPLMMLHNDQDDAVPWYQGIEYYLALRRLGKEVYLFNYNGELHGLRRKATQRDYTVRMQQFFDHHLKGAPMPEWMEKGVSFSERDREKEAIKKLFNPPKTEKTDLLVNPFENEQP